MPQRPIIAVTDDLMFHSRLEQRIRALGHSFSAVSTPEGLTASLDDQPALLIVDLHATSLEWPDAFAAAKERAVPVLAFGRHTEAQLLRNARAAGADRVVPRSELVEELERLIATVTA
jgi:CheY-like chemotaxis protein